MPRAEFLSIPRCCALVNLCKCAQAELPKELRGESDFAWRMPLVRRVAISPLTAVFILVWLTLVPGSVVYAARWARSLFAQSVQAAKLALSWRTRKDEQPTLHARAA